MRKILDTILVRWRAFTIWQKLGYNPWHQSKEKKPRGKKGRAFYKGAFDTIPFLNDDAKRTFSHLLLRPGYMIRDYIRGDYERYLAPLTSLIIFYAFFALISAVLAPVQQEPRKIPKVLNGINVNVPEEFEAELNGINATPTQRREASRIVSNTLSLLRTGYIYLHLDELPDQVDTQHESSIAALEGTLRNQGIPLFLGKFILLWLAMAIALRKYKLGMSAYAAISAYTLCQFSFFMLFAVLLTFGKSTSISILLMGVLLTFDLHQLLGISYKKSIRRAIAVGVHYCLIYLGMLLLASVVIVGVAYLQH
jgi:hypothetical protein